MGSNSDLDDQMDEEFIVRTIECPMFIRPYRPEDLPTLKEITVEAFDGVSIDQSIEQMYGIIHRHDWQWRKAKHLDDDVANGTVAVFVAEHEGKIVGYVTTTQDPEAGIGNVPNMAIAAGYRGQGLGRQLLLHAMDHLRLAGLTHARIATLVQNEIGIHLYTDLGFREISRQIHFVARL